MKKICPKDGFTCNPHYSDYCRGCIVIRKRQMLAAVSALFLAALAIAIALLVSGCHPDAVGTNEKTGKEKAIDACIASGGVPLFSSFNGSFASCSWPPGVAK